MDNVCLFVRSSADTMAASGSSSSVIAHLLGFSTFDMEEETNVVDVISPSGSSFKRWVKLVPPFLLLSSRPKAAKTTLCLSVQPQFICSQTKQGLRGISIETENFIIRLF